MSQLDLPPGTAPTRAATARATSPARDRCLRLREGVPVMPRGDGLVQVGSDPAHRALLPDTSSVRRLLQLLPYGVRTQACSAPEVLRALEAAGLLADEAEERLLAEARGTTRVRVVAPAPWRALVDELLAAVGLSTAGREESASGLPDVTLVVAWGEPSRDETDLLTSHDEPWLPVAVLERRVRVGPFVVPGRTACLRCLDAHDTGADPWHQVAPAPAVTTDGAPPGRAVDPLVLRHGLLTAVTDVARWAEGSQPLTWSATRTHRDAMTVEHRSWTRHPHCGCAWGDDLPTG